MYRRRQKLLLALALLVAFVLLRPGSDTKASQTHDISQAVPVKEVAGEVEPKQGIVFDEISADPAVPGGGGGGGPFPYEFLIDEPRFCEEDLQVVNMMPISVGDATSRARVRGMWGAKEVVASTRLRPLFLVGESRDAEQQRRLQEESDEYHDVIQVGFVDAYLNLTLKTLSALHWKHTRCPHVPWLLKSDADVFVSPWTVSRVLRNESADIVCRLLFSKNVCRPHNCKDERWFIPPEVYPHEYYPPYCNGPVYAVNRKFVREILTVASAENPFVMEDAYYTGILVQGLDLKYHNLGSRCQLYHLKQPPYETLARGRSLFLVNPEEKSQHRYSFEDLWKYLVSLRK
ncbi:beta-1,3-galactosyltransferase 2-like [Penaeus japonicus]|uniref:beta-1,3-galactosyltransferase 2-like n=1 Tax=Penaeus japonicus TaxID=27405 RepID=UPI001C7179B1|nr:beta-1,3-galactosyltransferase 2-like [Penaeus japonicus]